MTHSVSDFAGDAARSLLQSDRDHRDQDRTSDFVGLSVLIAVCLLFLLNICLCIYKLLAGDEEQREAVRRPSPIGRTRQQNAPIPVIFVNPGGSVRIGQKLKRSNSDPMDTHGESSASPAATHDAYPLREADIDLTSGSADAPHRPFLQEGKSTINSTNNV